MLTQITGCLILSILTRRPFDMVSALYYDDCQCLSEVVGDSRAHLDPKPPQKPATEKQTKKIQLWLKKEFGKEFTCEGDKMKHGKQEDTVNCGVYHLNTTEHELFGVEILTHGKRCLARMQWFIRLARAQLEHVSYVLWCGNFDHVFSCHFRSQVLSSKVQTNYDKYIVISLLSFQVLLGFRPFL